MRKVYLIVGLLTLSSSSWAFHDGGNYSSPCDTLEQPITECAGNNRQRSVPEIKELCAKPMKDLIKVYITNSCKKFGQTLQPMSIDEVISQLVTEGVELAGKREAEILKKQRLEKELEDRVNQDFERLKLNVPNR